MRCLGLILVFHLLGQNAHGEAHSDVLAEERAWRGVLEVSSKSLPPPGGKGGETQTERVEFLLTTKPPRRTAGWAKLTFTQRETTGHYTLTVDTSEGTGESARTTKGQGAGRLHAKIVGFLEPKTRAYRLAVAVTPDRIVAMQTLSGFAKGRFTTWRHVAGRRAFLAKFDHTGTASADLSVMEGEKTFVDRKVRLRRDVTVRWRIERIDPVLRGRVVDHNGAPLAGVEVVATNRTPQRRAQGLPPLRKEGRTDANGEYKIDVWWGHWNVAVAGKRERGLVMAGARTSNTAHVRFDRVDPVPLTVPVYRLAALPTAHKLVRHFQGDVAAYLAWITPRVPKARLRAALAPPAKR